MINEILVSIERMSVKVVAYVDYVELLIRGTFLQTISGFMETFLEEE